MQESFNLDGTNANRKKSTLLSFLKFKNTKSSNRTEIIQKKNNDQKEMGVTIVIGLLAFHEKDLKLKPQRGKRLSLNVKPSDGYSQILSLAINKWKLYCPEAYENKLYTLCYENGVEAILMPGDEEPFNLKKYKLEIGKEYRRIVLYLCLNEDLDSLDNGAGIEPGSDIEPETDGAGIEPGSDIEPETDGDRSGAEKKTM